MAPTSDSHGRASNRTVSEKDGSAFLGVPTEKKQQVKSEKRGFLHVRRSAVKFRPISFCLIGENWPCNPALRQCLLLEGQNQITNLLPISSEEILCLRPLWDGDKR